MVFGSCCCCVFSTPIRSVPYEVLSNLSCVGFAKELKHLHAFSLAARFRVASTSPEFFRFWELWDVEIDAGEYVVAPFYSDWIERSCIWQLRTARTFLARLRIAQGPIDNPKMVQSHAYLELRRRYGGGSCVSLLHSQLALRRSGLEVVSTTILEQAVKSLGSLHADVAMSYVKTVCNAWPTAWRYGGVVLPCKFCDGLDEELRVQDSLDHYFSCSAVAEALGEASPLLHSWLWEGGFGFFDLVTLNCYPDNFKSHEPIVIVGVIAHVLLYSYNQTRHCEQQCSLRDRLVANLKDVATKSKKLYRVVHDMISPV